MWKIKKTISVFLPLGEEGDHHGCLCIWFACKQNNSAISSYFSKTYRKTFSVIWDLSYLISSHLFFNVFLGARIYKFLSKFCILYKTSINDEFNKTFRKSFLLIKKNKSIEKAHLWKGVMFFCFFLRGSNFKISVIFF